MATYEWFTNQDSHVCNTCQALDGTQYSDADPTQDIPIPAHTGCRCRVLEVGTAEYQRAVVGRELRRQVDSAPYRPTPWTRFPEEH